MFNLLVFPKQREIATLSVWPQPKTRDWLTAVMKVLVCERRDVLTGRWMPHQHHTFLNLLKSVIKSSGHAELWCGCEIILI